MTAPFYLTKLLTPFFAPGASIVNTSSSRDRMSQPRTESYTAAKGGIVGLTHSKWNQLVPKQIEFPDASFFAIGFSHHRTILSKVKDTNERIFYIRRCADEKYSREALIASIARDDYHHQGSLPNNFMQTLPAAEQAIRAINTFKDEYLLDYINVEELGIRDRQDVDERVVENAIIHNVKRIPTSV